MLLKIDLEQDAELRNSIKNLVHGQVTAIVRDEILAIAEKKIESVITSYLDAHIEERIKHSIGSRWGNNPLNTAFNDKVLLAADSRIRELAGDLNKEEVMEKVALQIAKKFNV